MKPILLNQFSGINNWNEPWELHTPTRDDPTTELVTCSDFDITNKGKLIRRQGRTLKLAGVITDLFNANSTLVGVQSGSLSIIKSDFSSTTPLRAGFGAHRVSYVNINSITVFSDKSNIGYISAGAIYDFPTPSVEFKQPIPAGQLVEFYKGRLLVAHGNALSQSDPVAVRFAIDVNPASGGNTRYSASDLTLLKGVKDGIWVGDNDGLWWCEGDSVTAMGREFKFHGIPFLGMVTKVNPVLFGKPADSLFFEIATTEGICRIGEGGYFQNLTAEKYVTPKAIRGCMAFIARNGLNQTLAVFQQ